MENTQVIFKPIDKSAIVPKTHSKGAAGYDLYSIKSGTVQPLSTSIVKLGFSLKLPPHLFGYICGRSGFSKNHGINVENSYVKNEDEVEICITNYSNQVFTYEKGVRIAQIFFAVTEDVSFEWKSDE